MKPLLQFAGGRLRPARKSHLDQLVRLLGDPDVRRYLCDDRVMSREEVAEMLSSSKQLDEQGLGLWIIEAQASGFAGVIGLEPASASLAALPGMTGQIEPIIALGPDHTGQGLATASLTRLIDHARMSLDLPMLVAAVDEPNLRSHRLMRRCGFKATGKVRGPAHELIVYTLDFDDPAQ